MFSKNKKESIAFSDMLCGLQQAINSAQEILQVQQVHSIQGFFDENGKPVTQTVCVGDKKVNVPLMNVVPHNSLVMDDVEIKFKTRVSAVTTDRLAGISNCDKGNLSCANLQMEMDGIAVNDKDVMEVCIRFKAKDTPEGLSRILDEYNKQI